MHFPAEIFAKNGRARFAEIITELSKVKAALSKGETVTEQQLARVQAVLPLNLDAWDGYPMEREKLYSVAQKLGKQLVVVAGDTHNAWHGNLTNQQGELVGVEFATPGVTSPGMERYLRLSTEKANSLAQELSVLIDDLRYCNLHQRGYLTLKVSPLKVSAHWYYLDNILSEDYSIIDEHQAEYSQS